MDSLSSTSHTPSPYRPLYMTLAVATAVSGVFILLTAGTLSSLSLLSSKAHTPPSSKDYKTWEISIPPEKNSPLLFEYQSYELSKCTANPGLMIYDFGVIDEKLVVMEVSDSNDHDWIQSNKSPEEALFAAASKLTFDNSKTRTPIAMILKHENNNGLITEESWTKYLLQNQERLTELNSEVLRREVLPMILDQISENTARDIYVYFSYPDNGQITETITKRFPNLKEDIVTDLVENENILKIKNLRKVIDLATFLGMDLPLDLAKTLLNTTGWDVHPTSLENYKQELREILALVHPQLQS